MFGAKLGSEASRRAAAARRWGFATRVVILALLSAFAPAAASAHAGEDHGWAASLWYVLPLLAAGALWSLGLLRRWRRTRAGRPVIVAHGRWFIFAWLVMAAAVFSPLHEAGQRSFSAHMIEHEIIMMLAAPLFALSRPLPTLLWGLAQPWRRLVGSIAAWSAPFWRRAGAPMVATLLQGAALWLWHAPVLFNLALQNEFWHAAQHISFFVTALLFWSAMLDRRRAIGSRVLCLFATSLVSGALGALMALSTSPWYAPYVALGLTPEGLTPEQDQQLAGVLMWVPGGLLHAAAALALLAPWLRSDERAGAARA